MYVLCNRNMMHMPATWNCCWGSWIKLSLWNRTEQLWPLIMVWFWRKTDGTTICFSSDFFAPLISSTFLLSSLVPSFLPSVLLFHLPPSALHSSSFSPLLSFHHLILLWDRPALPAGCVRISVICRWADKLRWRSSCAAARGQRQWHQFAQRTTCLSVKTIDKG